MFLNKKEKINSKIKAVIFDVGGVLALPKYPVKLIQDIYCNGRPIHKNTHVHETITTKLRIAIDQWFDAIDTAYVKSITGDLPEESVVKIISDNLKISPKKLVKIVVKAYRLNFEQNKELYKFAFKLKKQRYKIAILSDQWQLSKKALVLPKYMKKFDEVVISCDIGLRKPDPKIFKLLLTKLKLKPSQCLFIDNQKWNTDVAKKLKFKTILYKDNKQLFIQLGK